MNGEKGLKDDLGKSKLVNSNYDGKLDKINLIIFFERIQLLIVLFILSFLIVIIRYLFQKYIWRVSIYV